jgi:squalene synthase HpnC
LSDADVATSADAYCRLLAARHYENFTVASRFVSPRVRRDLERVYAYCRTTDDLGDESLGDARSRLERWRADVEALFAGLEPIHPVLAALRETVERCNIDAAPFLNLIRANLKDQDVGAYETWADLRAYCTWSAAPVGRMVLSVFSMQGPVAERLSDDVCIGLQLANFAQDVSIDTQKGRSYLLQSELRSLGVAGAVHAHCERARGLLNSGKELEAMTPAPLRFQLALYRLGGMAITDAIARAGYQTDRVRPQVSKTRKTALLLRAFIGSARGSANAQQSVAQARPLQIGQPRPRDV